jgi:hypothetical protein
MALASVEEYNRLPRITPTTVVELVGLHIHRNLQQSPVTLETVDGQYRISQNLMAIAAKAHAKLLDGASAPPKGPLKVVLESLVGVNEGSESDGVAALCNQLLDEALDRVRDRLVSAAKVRFASEKEQLLIAAVLAVADSA